MASDDLNYSHSNKGLKVTGDEVAGHSSIDTCNSYSRVVMTILKLVSLKCQHLFLQPCFL